MVDDGMMILITKIKQDELTLNNGDDNYNYHKARSANKIYG